MFVRKVKRKCSVRGCKSTDCFAISRTREVGNTVIICKSCLGNALASLDEIDPKKKSNIPAIDNTPAPSLFFNAKALGLGASEAKADDEADSDGAASPEAITEFNCPNCGKSFKSEKGLKTHMKSCKPHSDGELRSEAE